MLRSLNEIEQTGRKAARGGGLPWGVADEVGRALRWLHAVGIDGASALAALFEEQDHSQFAEFGPAERDGLWRAPAGALSPLLLGIAVSDIWPLRAGRPIETAAVRRPALAAGFLGHLARGREPAAQLRWNGMALTLGRGGLVVDGEAGLHCAQTQSMLIGSMTDLGTDLGAGRVAGAVRRPAAEPAEVPAAAWAALERLAARTYVAATAHSRRGAGAGLSDND